MMLRTEVAFSGFILRTLPAMLLLLLAAPVQAVDLSIPSTTFTLKNGLEVILHQDNALPLTTVNIWYHAGPVNEAKGRTGFAHLFEHLMFQGSQHVGDDLHFKLLSGAGASSINGTTDFDRTNYFETVPKNQLALALWLESDRMGYLLKSLSQEKLDNQREVVKNERRQSVENVPYGPSEEKLVQTLVPADHPYYGNVIGSMADLEAASLEDVKDFFRRYYAPGNATLVVAGDIDMKEARTLIERYFSGIPKGTTPKKSGVLTPPLEKERRVRVEETVKLPRIQMGWLSAPFFTPGDAEADVLAFVLGGGKSSRLYKRLVYELELAQNVSVHQQSLALVSIFMVTATARPGVSIETLEKELEKVLDEVRNAPVQERELIRARNQIVTSTISGLQRIGRKANRLNLYNQYMGRPDFLAKDIARYTVVDAVKLQKTARTLLAKNKRAVIITTPKATEASESTEKTGEGN